jgi:AcrR family transcriptional regulator
MARLSRTEKKELTTSQLLETARQVFLERGYHRSTLDDIADAAGFTKGAVYARFKSKDELFFALYDDWVDQRIGDLARYNTPPKSFEALLRSDAKRLMALRSAHSDWYLLMLEFWTYAVRDERLRQEFAAHHERFVRELAKAIESSVKALGGTLKRSALHLARAGSAISAGVTLERLLDPQSVPESLMESLLVLLAGEVAMPGDEAKEPRQKSQARPRAVSA